MASHINTIFYRHFLRDCREFKIQQKNKKTLANGLWTKQKKYTNPEKHECNKFPFPDGTNKNVFSYHKF